MNRILIVDDEIEIAELISDALCDEGFDTRISTNGAEAYKLIREDNSFNLIILDIMMPEMDGLTLCKNIRDFVSCPIIFVTAKSRTLDMLVGLEIGADDYITKPFVVEELVAKVKAHIRRDNRSDKKPAGEKLVIGQLELSRDLFEVKKDGKIIKLSTREFQLLEYFMENVGKVLGREEIFKNIWGSDYGDIGTVAVNIKNLRNKLDPDLRYLKTIWGYGYKFVNPYGENNEN